MNEKVFIEWNHYDKDGNYSDADSIAAAKAMVVDFDIDLKNTVPPALTSNHIEGKAIDVNISWDGLKTVKNASGDDVELDSSASDNTNLNATLIAVGNSYGLKKLSKPESDPNHWSFDGR